MTHKEKAREYLKQNESVKKEIELKIREAIKGKK